MIRCLGRLILKTLHEIINFRHMKYIRTIALIALFSLGVQSSWAEDARRITTIAVIPFDNLSGGDLPLDFDQALHDWFQGKKIKIISQDTLEQFFIKRRIRRTSEVNRAIVRELGETLDVDALIMGSINLLSGGNNPKVDISVQMVDTLDSSIMWVNSVSYSGNDFATLLGIGKITSLKKLVEIAVKDLLKDMPEVFEEAKESNRGPASFEIVQASFYPKVTKGGSSVGLMIEVREIAEKPTYINAIVQDKEIPLSFDGDRWYSGSFISPRAEGIYTLKLYVAGKPNKVFLLDALASIVVDNTPPLVTIASHTVLISPNNDGVNDYVLFSPALMRAENLKGWRFEVRDKHGELVRSAEGRGELPGELIWRGENDAFKPVADGTYFAQLIIKDRADHEAATDKVIIAVDRTFPAVEIIPGEIEGRVVTFNVKSKEINDILEWNITIYDQDEEIIGTFDGKLSLPPTLSCTVKKKLLISKKTFLPIHLQSGMPRGICRS